MLWLSLETSSAPLSDYRSQMRFHTQTINASHVAGAFIVLYYVVKDHLPPTTTPKYPSHPIYPVKEWMILSARNLFLFLPFFTVFLKHIVYIDFIYFFSLYIVEHESIYAYFRNSKHIFLICVPSFSIYVHFYF